MALEAFATGKRRDDLCLPQVRARHVRGHAETDSVVKEAFVPRGALIVFGRAGRRADAVVRQPGGIAPGLGEVLRAQGIECAAAPAEGVRHQLRFGASQAVTDRFERVTQWLVLVPDAPGVVPDRKSTRLKSEERRAGKDCVSTCRSGW